MKRILHLTLYRMWFDKIYRGEKVEEYRRTTAFWRKRLEGKTFDEIHFRNGYAKDAPFMRVEWKGMQKRSGLGSYAIQLGKILEVKNYP